MVKPEICLDNFPWGRGLSEKPAKDLYASQDSINDFFLKFLLQIVNQQLYTKDLICFDQFYNFVVDLCNSSEMLPRDYFNWPHSI